MVQKITKQQQEFFAGCMLGDGNMKKPKGCINAMFQCQHGPHQKEYNQWKSNILESLGAKFYTYIRKTPNKKTNKLYESNITITNCNSEITKLHNMLYSTGKKKITKEILKNFTEFSLAVLFMDDGSLTKAKTNYQFHTASYTIASCGFDKESLELFRSFLLTKWNIETTISNDNRIYIKVNSRNLFEYLIYPYISKIPCMLYKFREMSLNPVNCLETPEEGNQQPSSCGDTEKGSTTSSESQVDNNSTTKAGQLKITDGNKNYWINYEEWKALRKFYGYKVEDIV